MATREKDEMKLYDNSQRYQSVYQKQLDKTIAPQDFHHPTRVPKGFMGSAAEDPGRTAGGNTFIKAKHELAVPEVAVTQSRFTQPFENNHKGVEMFSQTIQNLKGGRRKHHYS